MGHDVTNKPIGSPLNPRSERGAAMISYLAAFSLFVLASVHIIQNFSLIKEGQMLAEASSTLFDKDQLVRHEISKVLQVFQKRITELDVSVQCTPATTYPNFINVVQARFGLNNLVFFGRLQDIRTEANFPAAVGTAIDTLKSASQTSVASGKANAFATNVLNGLNRCDTRQSILKTGMATLAGRNSFYLCGYAQDFFVEVKATFWDFNVDQPMACNAMNERTGRGLQAVYNAYYFRRIPQGANKFPYSVRTHKGKLYVAKNVWSNN